MLIVGQYFHTLQTTSRTTIHAKNSNRFDAKVSRYKSSSCKKIISDVRQDFYFSLLYSIYTHNYELLYAQQSHKFIYYHSKLQLFSTGLFRIYSRSEWIRQDSTFTVYCSRFLYRLDAFLSPSQQCQWHYYGYLSIQIKGGNVPWSHYDLSRWNKDDSWVSLQIHSSSSSTQYGRHPMYSCWD